MNEQLAMLALVQGRYEQMHIEVNWNAALLWIVTAPFFALGWTAGFVVKCFFWMLAALVAGYKQGASK